LGEVLFAGNWALAASALSRNKKEISIFGNLTIIKIYG
jgi:hypothetical protein